MIICGIEIKGSEAIFALATRQDASVGHLPLATRKMALDDDEQAANVKDFAARIAGFVRENGISHIRRNFRLLYFMHTYHIRSAENSSCICGYRSKQTVFRVGV